ncbi:hypothetical protein [Microbacterium sp. 3J1]|uniref:hypothetical protein n=1 Tax=Microbacterium sp. 3J1 TaxID=861269 RepID=UPI000B33B594|nr:hypothetical protein [Microbacterium sp. 3J1]
MNTPDTQNTDSPPRPFGYWLDAVDRLMAAEFASSFADEHADRRDWRLLNAVDGTVPARRPLNPHKLHSLVERGWVIAEGDGWTLTDDGRAAKERLGAIVDGIRAKVGDAVSPEDLATTIASLEQIARAFGWDENTPLPRGRGRGRRHGFGAHGFRHGFGRAFGPRGFRRGFGHDHGPETDSGFADERGCEHRGHPGHDRFSGQHDPEHGEGPGHGHRDFGHGHGDVRGHGHAHHAHPQAAQHAYERGFDAGFSRGRDA